MKQKWTSAQLERALTCVVVLPGVILILAVLVGMILSNPTALLFIIPFLIWVSAIVFLGYRFNERYDEELEKKYFGGPRNSA